MEQHADAVMSHHPEHTHRHQPFPDGEFTPAELKTLGQCNALSNQEAKILLLRFVDSNRKSNKLYALPAMPAKALEYVTKLEPKAGLHNNDSVEKLRVVGNQRGILAEFEIALLTNLTPETVDEALSLVPSLQDGRFAEALDREHLQALLDEVLTLKELQ